jgi:tRNA (guanine-N7-)-methyltransferase
MTESGAVSRIDGRARTYIRRQGRITRAQADALARYGAAFRLPESARLDAPAVFGRGGPLVLEIGFGMGQALVDYARAHPEANCIGAEVYRPGIGALIVAARREGLTNLRVFEGDARVLLAERLAPGTLDLVLVYFPDPWPKKRHHKRRLVNDTFVELLASRLTVGGQLRLATDWEPYAQQMLAVLEALPQLQNEAGTGCFAPRPDERAPTRFEARGLRLGHRVWELAFRRSR